MEIGFRKEQTGTVDEWIECEFDEKYSIDYTLNMFKNIGSNGFISWVDMGSKFDSIKCKDAKVIIENSGDRLETFESYLKQRNLSSGYTETVTPVIRGAEFFYPLSPLFKSNTRDSDPLTDNLYELGCKNLPQPKNYNMFTKVLSYKMEIFPNNGVLQFSDSFAVCDTFNSWTIDGLGLPFPNGQFSGELNSVSVSNQLNKGASNPSTYGREYGEISKVTLRLDEENARLLLEKLRNIRDSEFMVTAHNSYYIFGHLYPNESGFNCILSDNRIKVKSDGFRKWDITFSIQLVAVI